VSSRTDQRLATSWNGTSLPVTTEAGTDEEKRPGSQMTTGPAPGKSSNREVIQGLLLLVQIKATRLLSDAPSLSASPTRPSPYEALNTTIIHTLSQAMIPWPNLHGRYQHGLLAVLESDGDQAWAGRSCEQKYIELSGSACSKLWPPH